MLFFEIVLWLVFILSFVGFTVVFGNRIFYNETRFITIRIISFTYDQCECIWIFMV